MTVLDAVPDARAMLSDLIGDHLPGGRVRLAVLAMSRDDNPKATVMAFRNGSATPAIAVKVALTPDAARSVCAEGAALQQVESLDPTRVGGTVPRCIELRVAGEQAALVMSAQAGVPLAIDYHRWRHTSRPACVARDFACAGRWLTQSALIETRGAEAPARPTSLCSRWPGDALAEAADAEARLIGDRLAAGDTGICHGDFWCGNVLQVAGLATGVVDWEHASFGADPLGDRVRFALSYSLYLDRHTRSGSAVRGHAGLVARRWGDGIRHVFRDRGWYADLVRGFVGDGLVASGRPREAWRDALLLGLAEIAAVSDQDEFARHHLELFTELTP